MYREKHYMRRTVGIVLLIQIGVFALQPFFTPREARAELAVFRRESAYWIMISLQSEMVSMRNLPLQCG